MKKALVLFLFSISSFAGIYDFKLKSGDKEISLSDYKNKTIMIVNIATKCGYTPQLDVLEKLHKEYKDKLVVIGIPSNDFAGQTPEGDKEVVKFCRLKYGVSFPLTPKSIVKGEKKIKVIDYLVKQTRGEEIPWNFTKFLISKNGKTVKRFAPNVSPMDKKITSEIK